MERIVNFIDIPQERSTFSDHNESNQNNENIFNYDEETGHCSVVTKKSPLEYWPRDGEIEFKNVWMRYRSNTPHVLRGVSFHINSGERVGICGRTGAGE